MRCEEGQADVGGSGCGHLVDHRDPARSGSIFYRPNGPRRSARPTSPAGPARDVIAFQQQQLHNDAMSTSITVRDVPDQTRDELASRAALSGRSLQEYLRAKLIELARQPDAEVLIARVRARKAASASTLPRDRILAYRDEDRR
jgi:antitoxin FitA